MSKHQGLTLHFRVELGLFDHSFDTHKPRTFLSREKETFREKPPCVRYEYQYRTVTILAKAVIFGKVYDATYYDVLRRITRTRTYVPNSKYK
eukprot:scaffold157533_cov22-Prasinocladus_malaysianus.AAC.1